MTSTTVDIPADLMAEYTRMVRTEFLPELKQAFHDGLLDAEDMQRLLDYASAELAKGPGPHERAELTWLAGQEA